MTSVNRFSPDIAICRQKVILWSWENLTNNSFLFLLKATLLGYCFNVNWGVIKTMKLPILQHPYPILIVIYVFEGFFSDIIDSASKISVSESPFFLPPWIIFPMAAISLFSTTAMLVYSVLIKNVSTKQNQGELTDEVITGTSSMGRKSPGLEIRFVFQ